MGKSASLGKTSVVALIFSVAAVLSFQYYSAIDLPTAESRLITHSAVIDGTAPNPYRYRVLAPLIVECAIRLLRALDVEPERITVLRSILFDRPEQAGSRGLFLLVYGVFEFLGIGLGLYAVFKICALFFTVERSLIGALIGAIAISLTFRDHYFHPWSLLELPLFGFGCLAIYQNRYRTLMVILSLAALNRETSVFLLLIFFLTKVYTDSGLDRSKLPTFAALGVTWLAIFIGLRWARGYPPPEMTVAMAWRFNTETPHLIRAVFLNAIIFGASWIYIGLGVKTAPEPIRRAAFAVVPYVATLLVIGYWIEIRYWITMAPLLIPLLVNSFSASAEKPRTSLSP